MGVTPVIELRHSYYYNETLIFDKLPVHSKKSILRMKTAFIDCAEADFLFVVAICIVI
jgi:hypothetical protein